MPVLFLSQQKNRRSLYEILNGQDGNVMKEIRKATADGCSDSEDLFMRMWIFIHGAACMTITGDYDLSAQATARMLISTYYAYANRK